MSRFLGLIPNWIVVSFPIIRYVLMFIIAISAVTLIIDCINARRIKFRGK